MAIDAPATIAIIGAGPIGIETALYARFLGYDVAIFERDEIGSSVKALGGLPMLTPFSLSCSPLGISAISTNDPGHVLPDLHKTISYQTWLDGYLRPLAKTDLLSDCFRLRTRVISIGKESYFKQDQVSYDERFEELFWLLIEEESGEQSYFECDIVIDCCGLTSEQQGFGPGGLPVLGESSIKLEPTDGSTRFPYFCSTTTRRGKIEFSQFDFNTLAGRNIGLVGDSYLAWFCASKLASLKDKVEATNIHWIKRQLPANNVSSAMELSVEGSNDVMPERYRLQQEANRWLENSLITWHTNSQVYSIGMEEDAWKIKLCGAETVELKLDALFSFGRSQPDWKLSSNLQLELSGSYDSPRNLESALKSVDLRTLTMESSSDSLVTSEPNYYVLGSKSFGRAADFFFHFGLMQILDLFKLINDRESLDLYTRPFQKP